MSLLDPTVAPDARKTSRGLQRPRSGRGDELEGADHDKT